ncbi:MAG: DUF4115 domain-containing protein [Bryobacterales bacterium]|nr:DUF4115 domain-containing protein [Bryobacterales bacterium]
MVDAKSIGGQLQDARLAQGLSIESLAASTRINRSYLTALEQNDYAAFPARIYAVSFLRQYANALGLPSDDLVSLFSQQLADAAAFPAPIHQLDPSLPISSIRLAAYEKIRRWIREFTAKRDNLVVAMGLLFVGSVGWWYASEPRAATTPAPVDTAAAATAAAPIAGAAAAARETARAASLAAALPSDTFDVELRAVASVWVRLVLDGGPSQEEILKAGESRMLRGRDRVQFSTVDAGALNLVVNGELQDALGGRQQTRFIQVERDGWRILPEGSF